MKYTRTPNRGTRNRQVIALKFRQLCCGNPTEQCIKEIQYHTNKLINRLNSEKWTIIFLIITPSFVENGSVICRISYINFLPTYYIAYLGSYIYRLR